MDRVDLTNEENMRSGEDRLALGSLNDKELHFAVEMAHLLRGFQKEGGDITVNNIAVGTIAVGTGTWGIAAVIPKYLSLRLPKESFPPFNEESQVEPKAGLRPNITVNIINNNKFEKPVGAVIMNGSTADIKDIIEIKKEKE